MIAKRMKDQVETHLEELDRPYDPYCSRAIVQGYVDRMALLVKARREARLARLAGRVATVSGDVG